LRAGRRPSLALRRRTAVGRHAPQRRPGGPPRHGVPSGPVTTDPPDARCTPALGRRPRGLTATGRRRARAARSGWPRRHKKCLTGSGIARCSRCASCRCLLDGADVVHREDLGAGVVMRALSTSCSR
jgi:hypothetical protein